MLGSVLRPLQRFGQDLFSIHVVVHLESEKHKTCWEVFYTFSARFTLIELHDVHNIS